MVIRMNKKIVIGIVLLIVAAIGAGCIGETTKYADTTSGQEAKLTESNQARLLTASPPPQLSNSLERENLIRRLNLLNDENKIFYIYLVSYGKVMAEYVAKGKVSSVNSKLTTQEQIVRDPFTYSSSDRNGKVVESPDLDGSYGTNGDAIFFFTSSGAYVEWSGEFMVSDFPMKLTTPPELIREIK
jgi:hypothetical protein